MSWELHQLVHTYAAWVDDRRAVAPLFTQDGVLVVPEPPDVLLPVHEHVGHDAITRATASLEHVPLTFHAVVGEVFEGTSGRIACVAHHVLDQRTDLVWHVRYDDDYRLTDQGWRFARRALTIELIETRPLKRARVP